MQEANGAAAHINTLLQDKRLLVTPKDAVFFTKMHKYAKDNNITDKLGLHAQGTRDHPLFRGMTDGDLGELTLVQNLGMLAITGMERIERLEAQNKSLKGGSGYQKNQSLMNVVDKLNKKVANKETQIKKMTKDKTLVKRKNSQLNATVNDLKGTLRKRVSALRKCQKQGGRTPRRRTPRGRTARGRMISRRSGRRGPKGAKLGQLELIQEIGTLKAKARATSIQNSILGAQVASLNAMVKKLESSEAEAREKVKEKLDTIDDLNQKISSLENSDDDAVEDLNRELSQAQGELEQARTQLADCALCKAAAEQRTLEIANLNQTIDDKNAAMLVHVNRIQDLETQLGIAQTEADDAVASGDKEEIEIKQNVVDAVASEVDKAVDDAAEEEAQADAQAKAQAQQINDNNDKDLAALVEAGVGADEEETDETILETLAKMMGVDVVRDVEGTTDEDGTATETTDGDGTTDEGGGVTPMQIFAIVMGAIAFVALAIGIFLNWKDKKEARARSFNRKNLEMLRKIGE